MSIQIKIGSLLLMLSVLGQPGFTQEESIEDIVSENDQNLEKKLL